MVKCFAPNASLLNDTSPLVVEKARKAMEL